MADAPERIWAFYTPDDFDDDATITAYETIQYGGQKYIRADLLEKAIESGFDLAASMTPHVHDVKDRKRAALRLLAQKFS